MINKQSNIYTVVYVTIMVIVVGAALALTATSLKPKQMANADADKMQQILRSVHISASKADVAEAFDTYITDQYVVNAQGEKIDGVKAFDVDVEEQSKETDADKRLLPVYVCQLPDAGTKYILPVYGAGLWGPIWGYISIDADGTTVYGAFFDHKGETPGLGAEITKPDFTNQFDGKRLIVDGRFIPVEVVKKGMAPTTGADYVDGVSGGTITSKGVGSMLDNCLSPYRTFLENLGKADTDAAPAEAPISNEAETTNE